MNGRIRLTAFVAIVVMGANGKEVGTIAQQQLNRLDPQAIAMKPAIDMTQLIKGQRVGTFVITSGYGLRQSPDGIGSTHHQGVDIATPIGTPVRMVMNGMVECHDQREGNAAGTYAMIKPDGIALEFLAGHLSQCFKSGVYRQGQVIGFSGSTGISTGPHIHWGQRPKGGAYVTPQRGWAELALGKRVGSL